MREMIRIIVAEVCDEKLCLLKYLYKGLKIKTSKPEPKNALRKGIDAYTIKINNPKVITLAINFLS